METVITSARGMLCFDLRRDLPLIMAAPHVTFATLIAFMDAWIIPSLSKTTQFLKAMDGVKLVSIIISGR